MGNLSFWLGFRGVYREGRGGGMGVLPAPKPREQMTFSQLSSISYYKKHTLFSVSEMFLKFTLGDIPDECKENFFFFRSLTYP